jgi:hypothetical protein
MKYYKWDNVKKFVYNCRENFSLYEACLGLVLVSMSILFLVIAYTVLLNGGLEYTVKIGK